MPRRTSLRLESLEARETPSANRLFAVSQDAGNTVFVYEAAGVPEPPYRDPLGMPTLVPYNGSGRLVATLNPYSEGFNGGVRLSLGDVTGDGVEDLVTAPASGGGPHIKVFDGAALLAGRMTLVREFMAFDPDFRGGTYLAIGQVDPSTPGHEIVVSAGTGGGPHVRIFSLTSNSPIRDLFTFDSGFRGGVRVAAGDINGDGRADVIAASGPGGSPLVRVYDVATARANLIGQFFAYDRSFRGGVYVAAGEVNGNLNRSEIVTGAGEGGGPHVKVWGGATGSTFLTGFFAGDSNSRAGARVGFGNLGLRTSPQSTLYVAEGDGSRGQTNTTNTGDPRLRSFEVNPFILMMAEGFTPPTDGSLFSFGESNIDLFDGFADSRRGGLNIG